MKEIWKDVVGLEGKYKVSNFGNIKSLNYRNTGTEHLLSQRRYDRNNNKNYLKVFLAGKEYSIHRLVATAFIPNPNNLPCVNHKDENPSNNCVSNLEWCSYEYNCNYGHRTNKCIDSLGKTVICIETGKTYKSLREAERDTGTPHDGIAKCCNGVWKYAGGLHWKYGEK